VGRSEALQAISEGIKQFSPWTVCQCTRGRRKGGKNRKRLCWNRIQTLPGIGKEKLTGYPTGGEKVVPCYPARESLRGKGGRGMFTSWQSSWIFGSLAVIGIISLIEIGHLWLLALVFWPLLFLAWEEIDKRR